MDEGDATYFSGGLMVVHFILYVKDQKLSTEFYAKVLDTQPVLDVPGMTEFQLTENCILGLMPVNGIKKLLGPVLPDPGRGQGIPRNEIYLIVDDCREHYQRAIRCGAVALSEAAPRDWGHLVAYCMDKDGHVLAFAESV